MVNPAFAEVTNLHTNNDFFTVGDEIEFSGTVEEESTGLVTIVIRDLNNEFVLLTQATINHDNTFEKTITIENKFTQYGIYNATSFILNMTQGITSEFHVLSDETLSDETLSDETLSDETLSDETLSDETLSDETLSDETLSDETLSDETLSDETLSDETLSDETENKVIIDPQNTTLETNQNNNSMEKTKIINSDFVDTSKDPSYYIERYYSEPAYKSWFDRNYPGQTIEETVRYTNNVEKIKSVVNDIIDKEIIPEAQASSISTPSQKDNNNSDIAQISLVLAALGILFGAVYGVKRQVDSNSRQISINRDSIRIPKIIHHRHNPKEILETRLAKGEITLEEYEKLKSKLD